MKQMNGEKVVDLKAVRMAQLFEQAAGEENVSLRQENVKHFNLGTNRYQAVVFPEPVHFRDEQSGEWLDIDNTLEESVTEQGRAVLRNRANGVRIELPKQADDGAMAALTRAGKTFSWRFEGNAAQVAARVRNGGTLKHDRLVKMAQAMPRFVGRTLDSLKEANLETELESAQEQRGDLASLKSETSYENVRPGVSVRYTLNGDILKEDIILANAAALANAAIRLPDTFSYTVTEQQALLICEKDSGAVLFTMDPARVYDAAGTEILAELKLTSCSGYTRLEYLLDADYLADAVYPVTIDPVTHSTNAIQNIQDTTLCEGSSVKPYTTTYLKIGTESSSRRVALLKFNQLARLNSSDTVISAVLQMAPKSSSTSKYIGAYEVLKPWESASVCWTNFNPDSTSNISTDAQECITGSSSTWLNFDLTNLYRKWCTNNASGASNNNGVAFRTPANITGTNYSELYSSDASSSYRPVMYVNYISHAGIEGWWQYEQMSVGRAGTVYADLFNGNMVLEHSDTAMTGNRMPVSVNHYYNSCLSMDNKYNCGYGWKTDAHQKVTALTLNSKNYFVWEDGDGTEHFFEQTGTQPYKDAEGMDMKLTYSSTGKYIIIEDKETNQMRFNIVQTGLAWLAAARDASQNTVTYTYVSGYEAAGRINTITDPVGRVTKFNYSGALLSSIQIPAANGGTRYIYYTYDSANRLTGIRYGELGGTSAHSTFGYDGSTKMLTKLRNYDGLQVNVGYEATSLYNTDVIIGGKTDQMRRVITLENTATNSSGTVTKYGAKQLFEYKPMCTEVTAVDNTTSNAGKKLYYQFNDAGNVVCVRDDLGYARFTKFESGIENKPSEESPLRRAVVNILRSADLAANWTASGSAVKDTSVTCLSAPSVKLTANGSESLYRQEVMLAANTRYTFSAYLKTSGVSGAFGAYLRISKKTNTLENVSSDPVTGTTDAAIGNELPTDGWERVHVNINHASGVAEVYYVDMVLSATAGTAWFACPQLETGDIVNPVNLVSNGDFRYTYASGAQTLAREWTKGGSNLTTAPSGVFAPSMDSEFPEALSGNYIQVEGRPNYANVGYVQTFNLKGKKGDVFVVGGWANAKSVPNATKITKGFGIAMRLKKTDGTWIDYYMLPYNGEWVGWQFGSWALVAGYDYTAIDMTLVYTRNCGNAKFSNVFMYREQFGQSFAYDDDKNVVSTGTLSGQKSEIVYDSAKNITKYTQPGRDAKVEDNQYWFYYGSTDADKKKHLLWRSRTPMHMTDYFSYDAYGNTTASRKVDYRVYTGNKEDSAYPYIRTENTYTTNGNYTATTKDARGNTVTQAVDANAGTLTSVTDPANQTVNYTYDASKRVTAVQTTDTRGTADPADDVVYRNAYTYENDRIKTVSHNTTSNTANDVTYTFGYDALGRKTAVKVGSQVLSTNVYANTRNGLLSEVDYGNEGKVKYTYDEFDRLSGVKYDSDTADRYAYTYGANGQAAEVKDTHLGRTVKTEYDLSDRPCQVETRETATDNLLYKTRLKYDKLGNLAQFAEKTGSDTHTSAYTYDRDNRVTEIDYDGTAQNVKYAYDELGRVKTRTAETGTTAGKLTSTYGYAGGGYGTNSTTPLVASIAQSSSAGTAMNFAYAYDNRGNITSETRNGAVTTYAYDALGQLIRVNDPHENATWVFNYDRGGNIVSKVKYAYTTGTLGAVLQTIPYVYGDSNWKDKLTAYNGVAISYDDTGNPLNDGTWAYQWQAGRQLRQMSKSGTTVQFQYDHNGLRVGKVVNGVTTNYTLHGKLVTHMTQGSNTLHFFYDAQSRPAKVNFNGAIYTYLHNLHGDIVGILDGNGALVVEYKYDAWGRKVATTGSMAETLGLLNPFRYRGYVYDEETGLYYLRSRYYNPIICRYNSTDCIYGATGKINSCNLYTYCFNAPCDLTDSDGTWPNWGNIFAVVAVVAIAVAVVATSVATCGLAAPALAGVAATVAGTATSATIVAEASLATAAVTTVAAVVYECDPKDQTVYCLADPVTNEIEYVGRTRNYEKRMQAHQAPGSRTQGLVPVVRISNLTYVEARGLEEIGMAYYHTRSYMNEAGKNLIRGISLKNKRRAEYLNAGRSRCGYLYNKLNNMYLNWREALL